MSDISRPAQNRLVAWSLAGLLGMTFLTSIGFVYAFALPYLLLDTDVLARFQGRWPWILVHIATGSLALLVGPIQLWLGTTGTATSLHRKLGLIYLLSIAVSSVAAFYLAVTNQVTWVFGMGLGGLGCAWVVTTSLAYVAVLRGSYLQHKEWMIRSYVVTLGFVFFRAFVGAMEAFEVGTLFERLNAASWFCWAFPLLVTEAAIQGRKVLDSRAAP